MIAYTEPSAESLWRDINGNVFRVIDVYSVDDHTWVHYIRENGSEQSQEYSCYLESFLSLFWKMP